MKNMRVIKRVLEILRKEGLNVLLKKSISVLPNFYGIFFYPIIMRRFKSSIRNIDNISDAVKFAFQFEVFGISIKPIQISYEIVKLLELVAELKPKVILEIGTAGGGTLFLFTRVADSEALIISIDLPAVFGLLGEGYPMWKIPLYKSFSKEKQKIFLIQGDSHSIETLRKIKEILRDDKIDFLFIDGDHSYEGVKKDFEMYSPLVRKGGIIAFHDIVPRRQETRCEVDKFWNEIKYNYRYIEIVRDWAQKRAGIGVLYI
jgi:predicted O-methyltransferase YrrM